MKREAVGTAGAPKAIGPYSQAVRAGGFLFCSGQLPLDPSTGKMVDGGIEAQTERVLSNLEAVLNAGGATLRSVVKTTVYLVDMGDFPAMNAVYGKFFPEDPPARATVQIVKLAAGAMCRDRCGRHGSDDRGRSGRLDDPPGLDARGAGVDVTHRPALDRLHALDVRLPYPRGTVVGVGDVVPEAGSLTADCALGHGFLRKFEPHFLPRTP